MHLNVLRFSGVAAAQIAISVFGTNSTLAQEAPKTLLAAQVRDQGFRCDKPVRARRDLARSKPDSAVWVLRCEASTYRLRLVPDMAARVQRLK
jgi:hypothetical protein